MREGGVICPNIVERGEIMRIPWEIIVAFAIGLAAMGLIGYLLLIPMRFLWRMAAGGILGAVALMLINFFGGIVGFSIAVNPFTALTVGLLGLPGALLVGLLSVYL